VHKGETSARLANDAWQAAGTWVLTGEQASFDAVQPKKPIGSGIGALALSARYGQLRIDEQAFTQGFAEASKCARKARAWALGLSWWLNANVRYVVSFERTTFEGGNATGNRRPENVLAARAQLLF